MTVRADALPLPHRVAVRGGPLRRQSQSGDLLLTATPDPSLRPREFSFRWLQVPGVVADVVRRHYREHCHRVFAFTLPRTAEVVRLKWLSAPNVQWDSRVAASSIAAEFEEVLAYE